MKAQYQGIVKLFSELRGKWQYSGDECGYPEIACGRCSESGMEEE